MFKRIITRETLKRMLKPIAVIAAAIALITTFIVMPVTSQNRVEAASAPVPINMIYYGWLNSTISQNIVNTHPLYLVANSPAGPWHGNANISQFTAAGIKYFEYIDGGCRHHVGGDSQHFRYCPLDYRAYAVRAISQGEGSKENRKGKILFHDRLHGLTTYFY